MAEEKDIRGLLSPCPFCGFAAGFADRGRYEKRRIKCLSCDAKGPARQRDVDAVTAWNCRA